MTNSDKENTEVSSYTSRECKRVMIPVNKSDKFIKSNKHNLLQSAAQNVHVS